MLEVLDRPNMEGAGKMGGSCRLCMKKSFFKRLFPFAIINIPGKYDETLMEL